MNVYLFNWYTYRQLCQYTSRHSTNNSHSLTNSSSLITARPKMAITNKVLLCSVFILCIGFVVSKGNEKELDKALNSENVVVEDGEDSSSEEEDAGDDMLQKIALFVEAYKKTAKVVEEGIEKINKHVTTASKNIGQEIVDTFQKMKKDREEL